MKARETHLSLHGLELAVWSLYRNRVIFVPDSKTEEGRRRVNSYAYCGERPPKPVTLRARIVRMCSPNRTCPAASFRLTAGQIASADC